MIIASSAKYDYYMYMTETQLSPFRMNLPTELKTALTEQAKRNNRSLSGEIIFRLELSLKQCSTDIEGNTDIVLTEQESEILKRLCKTEKRYLELQEQVDSIIQLSPKLAKRDS